MVAEETSKRTYTVDEYLQGEKTAKVKHEFVDGILFETPGQSKRANEIAGNLYVTFHSNLRNKSIEVYNHDVKLHTLPGRKLRYPDIMVVPADDAEDTHVVNRAIVTVEVTSEN